MKEAEYERAKKRARYKRAVNRVQDARDELVSALYDLEESITGTIGDHLENHEVTITEQVVLALAWAKERKP